MARSLTSIAAYRGDIRKNRSLAWPMDLQGSGRDLRRTGAAEHAAMTFCTWCPGCCWWPLNLCRHRPCFALAGAASVRCRQCEAPPRLLMFSVHHFRLLLHWVLCAGRVSDHYPLSFSASRICMRSTPSSRLDHYGQRYSFVIFVVGRQVEWRYCMLPWLPAPSALHFGAIRAQNPQSILRGIVIAIGFSMAGMVFSGRNR